MKTSLDSVKKNFTLTLVGFTFLVLFILGFALYETNIITFSNDVSSDKLHSVIEDNPAVQEYMEQEKDYEAHFITIANLIREDQQKSLGEAFILVGAPVILLSLVAGYFLSRRLVKPVEEAFESQERFIQDAAHELRNPLAAMSAAIQAFASNGKLSVKEKKLLLTMRRQTSRLVKIAENLLFLERRESQEVIKDINISELLMDVVEDLKHISVKKQQELKLSIDDNIHRQICEKDFILLARNLIENAIKYTPKGKQISVSLKQTDKRVVLKVADKGIGIPSGEIDMLGERFFRASNSSKHEGNGLGLAIVNKVLNRYNGSIDIASTEGKGTVVQVTL